MSIKTDNRKYARMGCLFMLLSAVLSGLAIYGLYNLILKFF